MLIPLPLARPTRVFLLAVLMCGMSCGYTNGATHSTITVQALINYRTVDEFRSLKLRLQLEGRRLTIHSHDVAMGTTAPVTVDRLIQLSHHDEFSTRLIEMIQGLPDLVVNRLTGKLTDAEIREHRRTTGSRKRLIPGESIVTLMAGNASGQMIVWAEDSPPTDELQDKLLEITGITCAEAKAFPGAVSDVRSEGEVIDPAETEFPISATLLGKRVRIAGWLKHVDGEAKLFADHDMTGGRVEVGDFSRIVANPAELVEGKCSVEGVLMVARRISPTARYSLLRITKQVLSK